MMIFSTISGGTDWIATAWSWAGSSDGKPIIALVLGTMALGRLLPGGCPSRINRVVCVLAFFAAAALWFSTGPLLGANLTSAATWALTLVTLGSGLFMVASRKPVYAAIWFALTLLGVGGLFFVAGAQFLGVATVAVYAGAILVTFLFVLMLAQPEGHAFYDRISWGRLGRFGGAFAGLALATLLISAVRSAPLRAEPVDSPARLMNPEHVANLGARLFSTYLVEVQIAGVLLFVALVGAVMIASQRPARWNWNSALERALTSDRDT